MRKVYIVDAIDAIDTWFAKKKIPAAERKVIQVFVDEIKDVILKA
jgi:hypothetical protein